ncbi:Hypothetical predicted protein [Podarcis lilfordi]|uniref:Uncharacterized protein n=1 Tax=Podarcis lilfordi TaxID=74358 RepID=A0AA35JUN0_9SAUR|nr:Hypothetical predicted protein [Podarcis lilfordi]
MWQHFLLFTRLIQPGTLQTDSFSFPLTFHCGALQQKVGSKLCFLPANHNLLLGSNSDWSASAHDVQSECSFSNQSAVEVSSNHGRDSGKRPLCQLTSRRQRR